MTDGTARMACLAQGSGYCDVTHSRSSFTTVLRLAVLYSFNPNYTRRFFKN